MGYNCSLRNFNFDSAQKLTNLIEFDIIRDHWDLTKPVLENFEDFKKQ